jgi:protein TonB
MSFVADTILPKESNRGVVLWGAAAALIVAAHIVVGIIILLNREPEIIGNNAADAILIDLTPIATAPAQEKMDTPQPQEVKPEPIPPEEKPQEEKPEEAMAPPVPEQQPVEAVPIQQTSELPQVPQSEVMLEAPPKPQELKPEEPKPEPKPLPKKDVPKKPVVKKPEAKPAHVARAQPNAERTQASAPAVASYSNAAWMSALYSRINQFQHYPEAARSHGDSGTASVSFTVDGSGRVVSVRLKASSGSSILDQEALATVRRASPWPAPPSGASVTVNVPIRYSLGH